MASEPRVPPEDQSQREGEGERGRQRESERVREGEMLQSSGFCHKIQWSCSQFRSQACPEGIGGTQVLEQKCRVIAEQHRESSFKKLDKKSDFHWVLHRGEHFFAPKADLGIPEVRQAC